MALAVYLDVHVPAAIAEGLRRRGIDVLTSQQDGTRRAEDAFLLRRATQLRRILVTQDEDFLVVAASWQDAGWEFTGLVFAPQDSQRIGRYIRHRTARGVLQHPRGRKSSLSFAVVIDA